MQTTDRPTEAAVEGLSRYEIAGLRRAAEYGDDEAAFQLGMVYEIGHGVRQSCSTAASWVAKAANEGNAAAQYNLWLRYRDGDGVAVNQEEGEKWLRKAVAQKYSEARLLVSGPRSH
jgi:TPR repeat protein